MFVSRDDEQLMIAMISRNSMVEGHDNEPGISARRYLSTLAPLFHGPGSIAIEHDLYVLLLRTWFDLPGEGNEGPNARRIFAWCRTGTSPS